MDFSEEDFSKFLAYMRRQQASESEETSGPTVTESEEPDILVKTTSYQTDNDDEENFNPKIDFVIEERLHSMTSRDKFYEAVSLFESIEFVAETDIGLKLLIAECYIQLGRESKAEKAVREVEKILMKPPMCDADDVMALALDFSNNANYIRALLLLRIASDMFYNTSSLLPDDKIDRVFRCISKMDDVIDEMVGFRDVSEEAQNILTIQKALTMVDDGSNNMVGIFGNKEKTPGISERTRVLSLDYGVEVMEEMLEKINSIQDADAELKTLKLARAAVFINSQYKEPSQFSKAVKVLQFAIDLLEKQFGKNAKNYRIYGEILYNIGSDYHNSEKYREAEVFAMRALEANEYALDFESEEKRRHAIKRTQEALKTIHSHIKSA